MLYMYILHIFIFIIKIKFFITFIGYKCLFLFLIIMYYMYYKYVGNLLIIYLILKYVMKLQNTNNTLKGIALIATTIMVIMDIVTNILHKKDENSELYIETKSNIETTIKSNIDDSNTQTIDDNKILNDDDSFIVEDVQSVYSKKFTDIINNNNINDYHKPISIERRIQPYPTINIKKKSLKKSVFT
jgi:hypothetical protein